MKKLKLITIALLIGSYSCQGQHNILSESEFYSIKINAILLSDILETNADVSQMHSLFGNNLHYEIQNDNNILMSKLFWKPNLFDINFDSDDGSNYFISFINISDPSVVVTVREMSSQIGESVSVLGSDVIFDSNFPTYDVVFIDNLTQSAVLIFKVDSSNHEILSIKMNFY